MNSFWINLKIFSLLTLITGFIYPLIITAIAFLIAPKSSSGSLILDQENVIGSSLIAQKFTSDKYFWPRPSSTNYQTLPSNGSNRGMTSKKLMADIKIRQERFSSSPVPAELLYASGSGLDPHISLEAAFFQSKAIGTARNIDEKRIHDLIYSYAKHPFFGIFGNPYINVLEINLALDKDFSP